MFSSNTIRHVPFSTSLLGFRFILPAFPPRHFLPCSTLPFGFLLRLSFSFILQLSLSHPSSPVSFIPHTVLPPFLFFPFPPLSLYYHSSSSLASPAASGQVFFTIDAQLQSVFKRTHLRRVSTSPSEHYQCILIACLWQPCGIGPRGHLFLKGPSFFPFVMTYETVCEATVRAPYSFAHVRNAQFLIGEAESSCRGREKHRELVGGFGSNSRCRTRA